LAELHFGVPVAKDDDERARRAVRTAAEAVPSSNDVVVKAAALVLRAQPPANGFLSGRAVRAVRA
jgi:hypothetical protein